MRSIIKYLVTDKVLNSDQDEVKVKDQLFLKDKGEVISCISV
jgi:hypothetical protein